MSSVVTAQDMESRYGDTVALDRITFTVDSGVTALLGPNGAGKTTLLNSICGLRAPSSGTLTVLGERVSGHRGSLRRHLAREIGFLPQAMGFLPAYSVRDFVTYAAWLKEVPKREISGRVDGAIAAVGLAERAPDRLKTLSGGMLRRVGIATAIVHGPKLLILDEPSAGLDPQQRVELRSLLGTLGESTSIILSTHLIEDIRSVARQILVLEAGRIRFAGTPRELQAQGAQFVPQTSANADVEIGLSAIELGYLAVLSGSSLGRELNTKFPTPS